MIDKDIIRFLQIRTRAFFVNLHVLLVDLHVLLIPVIFLIEVVCWTLSRMVTSTFFRD